MPTFRCTDGNADINITADSAVDAAAEYVDGGDWGNDNATFWVTVYTAEIIGTDGDGDEILGDRESHRITVEPAEPECSESEHDWREEYVRGHGGGVIVREVCRHCGLIQTTDTWAQCPQTGVQGLRSVSYEAAE